MDSGHSAPGLASRSLDALRERILAHRPGRNKDWENIVGYRHKEFVRRRTYWIVLAIVITAGAALGRPPRSQVPAQNSAADEIQKDPPKHGLIGTYYVSNLELHNDVQPPHGAFFVQTWIDDNDFGLPRAFEAPAATRVDPQIAFGQGKGFSQAGQAHYALWAPTGYALPADWTSNNKPWENFAAAIWKGYIHFPKAGTYYFATISKLSSAVYLNDARVVLNGNFGGVTLSDAFSYADADVSDYFQKWAYGRRDMLYPQRPNESYTIPVPIDKPRDVRIEVQYTAWTHDQGIDLFWVSPDSPKDSNGKPIAQIVPSEVLYTDPPSTIEPPVVRKANSTVSADFLYFPTESSDQWVTVKVRLADQNGHPVSGKQVHVS